MTSWVIALGAIAQVAILLLKAHYAKDADVKQLQVDKAKEISDAIASGDLARINSIVNSLRN